MNIGTCKPIAALLLIVALTASSLLMIESASAVQSITKPSVPNFTIYLVNHPYDIPPTEPIYTTDPYTGEQKLVTPGYAGRHVDNVTVELWILNQQPSYSNGTTTFTPYYNVRTKGHFAETWRELYELFEAEYSLESNETRTYLRDGAPQSTSKYTILTPGTYPPNGTVDFQVSAMIGHLSPLIVYDSHIMMSIPYKTTGIALDAQSGWSETQSITISSKNTILASTLENPAMPVATPIPIPTDTPSPTVTPAPTQSPTSTPTLKPTLPNTTPNPTTLSVDTLVLIITAIALTAVAISVLLYARYRNLKRNAKGAS